MFENVHTCARTLRLRNAARNMVLYSTVGTAWPVSSILEGLVVPSSVSTATVPTLAWVPANATHLSDPEVHVMVGRVS
jgi:hypothetical protein